MRCNYLHNATILKHNSPFSTIVNRTVQTAHIAIRSMQGKSPHVHITAHTYPPIPAVHSPYLQIHTRSFPIHTSIFVHTHDPAHSTATVHTPGMQEEARQTNNPLVCQMFTRALHLKCAYETRLATERLRY